MPTGVYKRKKEDIEKFLKNSGNPKGNKMSAETKKKISKAHMGKKGHPAWNKGLRGVQRHSKKTRRKISEAQKEIVRTGKHPFWKGGITPINKKIRRSLAYRFWRESVFERDNYTCQHCDVRGGNLEADHIKPFAFYPELRLELSNGRTLCRECHRKTDTYLWKANKNKNNE